MEDNRAGDRWIGVIKENLEKLIRQKHLMMLPNRFVERDARREALLYMAYFIDDTYDYGYLGYTPQDMAQMLRDISDAIYNSTEKEVVVNL